MRLSIASFFHFKPTPSQSNAISALESFLTEEKSEHPIFLLQGYAGTGKSFLVGAVTKAALHQRYSVRLLAPTGRAAKVLSKYCGIPAQTIHRAIYRQKVVATGEATYDLNFNSSKNATLYIVDESSMISNNSEGFSPFGSGRLLDDLIEFCFEEPQSRILFVGDDAQLPPIGTLLSPAMSVDYLKGYSDDVRSARLTDIVRQEKRSEIIFLSYQLRILIHQLTAGKPVTFPLLPLPSLEKEIEFIQSSELPDAIETSFRHVGEEETVIVTRSNRSAELFNKGIRAKTLYYDEEIISGEYLMVVRNNYLYLPLDEEGKPTNSFLANGEMLRVITTNNERSLYGFTFRDAELIDNEGAFLSATLLVDTLYNGSATLTPEQRQQLYTEISKDYPECTSTRKLHLALRKDPYLNALQVKYPYAMTVHKAQGGQWKHVYLCFDYLTPEMVDLSFCRWLYTAITRASEKLFIINPPHFLFQNVNSEEI